MIIKILYVLYAMELSKIQSNVTIKHVTNLSVLPASKCQNYNKIGIDAHIVTVKIFK